MGHERLSVPAEGKAQHSMTNAISVAHHMPFNDDDYCSVTNVGAGWGGGERPRVDRIMRR